MMKQIYLLGLALSSSLLINAQSDTLIWEDFNGETWTEISETELFTQSGNTFVYDYPTPADGADKWFNTDLDGLTDQNDRPVEWFRAGALTSADSVTFDAVYASSSWFTSPGAADNWLITKSFYCSGDAVLSWYSSPRQAPLYLDGYKVKVSTLSNDPFDFTTTIFTAAEYVSRQAGDSCLYSNYTFAPASAFVHGQDGTYITDNGDVPADCQRNWGSLQKHTVNLSQFANQRIYVAFVHDSYDDNLITLDNVLVLGTEIDDASIEESDLFTLNVYPNPTADVLNINYALKNASDITVKVTDNIGRTVKLMNLTQQNTTGNISLDVADLSAGVYNVSFESANGRVTKRVIKK